MNDESELATSSPPVKVQAIEVIIFLLLILPSMIMSTSLAKPVNLSFSVVAWATILSDIPVLALVLYFLWRNSEAFRSIGLTLRNGWKEAFIGAAIFIPLLFAMGVVEKVLREAGLSVPKSAPSFLVPAGGGEIALALLFLIVVAVSEEVIFRGYLIRRFAAISKNPAAALVLSSFIFALGHGYQRTGGIVGVGILGLVFGAVYLWRKSLIAPIVMHFIQNFIGIIIVPLIR